MIDSSSLSVSSVGSIPNTETPPPGYMSEDGDPMDQNDNMSESLLVSPEEHDREGIRGAFMGQGML